MRRKEQDPSPERWQRFEQERRAFDAARRAANDMRQAKASSEADDALRPGADAGTASAEPGARVTTTEDALDRFPA